MIKKIAKKFLPPGTLRFKVARKIAAATGLIQPIIRDARYQEWVERTEPFTWSALKKLSHEPKISIVVPVYNPPDEYFLPMVYSVVGQTYENWELVLVNASTKAKCRRQTEDCVSIDKRIKVVNLSANKGIAGNTNAGIEAAAGEYVGLLDHDDLLAPAALYEVVLALQDNQSAGLIYSDEDKVSANSEERFEPHFKPDWSPHLLKELNYLNHFTVIKKTLLDKTGGYRTGFDGAQDYDLFLRLVDENPVIIHVPKILYHWRTTETSTANDFSKKKNVLSAGIRAIEDHLERNKQTGTVTALEKQPGFYKISYKAKPNQTVGLLIMPSPIAGQYDLLVKTLAANLKGTSLKVEIFVRQPVEKPLAPPSANISINYIETKLGREFIEKVLAQTQAATLVIINAAVIPKTKRWLSELSSIVEQDDTVGAVAPLLTTTDRKMIFDAGYVKRDGHVTPLFKGYPRGQHTYLGNTDWIRNVDAISGRCFAIRTAVAREYLENSEARHGEFAPEDLCEYLKEQGLQIVLWPFVRFVYRGELKPKQYATEYFNPALTLVRQEFSVPKTINVPPPEETDD